MDAILLEDELEDQKVFIEINDEPSRVWPNITERKDPLPDADDWDGVPNRSNIYEELTLYFEERTPTI